MLSARIDPVGQALKSDAALFEVIEQGVLIYFRSLVFMLSSCGKRGEANMRCRLPLLCITAYFGLAACAGIAVKDVTTTADNEKADGFRYYEKSAFLIIAPDGKGGLDSKVEFICDTSRKRAADPYAILANNKSTLTFDKGCLTSAETSIDETPLPKAVVDAVKTAASAALSAFLDADGTVSSEKAFPGPAIYRLSIEGGAVVLRGDSRQEPIFATISQPAKAKPPGEGGGQ